MIFKPYEVGDEKYLNYWFMWFGYAVFSLIVVVGILEIGAVIG